MAQRRLFSDGGGALTLCKPNHNQSPAISNLAPTRVLDLPDSILLEIFELIWNGETFPCSWFSPEESAEHSILALTRVSKRFCALSQPLVFRCIKLSFSDSEFGSTRYLRCLRQVLNDKPELRALTRTVSMYICYEADTQFDVDTAVQFIRWWAPSLRQLMISGSFLSLWSDSLMPELSTLSLATLRLCHYSIGISLSFFLKFFLNSPLVSLRLYKPCWTEDRDSPTISADQWKKSPSRVLQLLEHVHLPTKRQHTGQLKCLDIYEPYVPPQALELLLKWPRALEEVNLASITLCHTGDSPLGDLYTPSAVESILAPQSHSLKAITIGVLFDPFRPLSLSAAAGIPDVSNFAELETIALAHTDIFHTPPEIACSRLAAPKLRCLNIQYWVELSRGQRPTLPTVEEIDWLIRFAKIWRSVTLQMCFQHIRVVFKAYPMDRMGDRIRNMAVTKDQISKYNIDLTWGVTSRASFAQIELDVDHIVDRTQRKCDFGAYQMEVKKLANVTEEVGDVEEQDDEEHEDSSNSTGTTHKLVYDPSQLRLCRMPGPPIRCTYHGSW